METTDEWNKVKGFIADKLRRPVGTLTITLDSVRKVERGNGPNKDRLVALWPQMTAAGRETSLLMIQGDFVAKSGTPVRGPKGTLILSCAIEKMRVKELRQHLDTSVKIIKLNQDC